MRLPTLELDNWYYVCLDHIYLLDKRIQGGAAAAVGMVFGRIGNSPALKNSGRWTRQFKIFEPDSSDETPAWYPSLSWSRTVCFIPLLNAGILGLSLRKWPSWYPLKSCIICRQPGARTPPRVYTPLPIAFYRITTFDQSAFCFNPLVKRYHHMLFYSS